MQFCCVYVGMCGGMERRTDCIVFTIHDVYMQPVRILVDDVGASGSQGTEVGG